MDPQTLADLRTMEERTQWAVVRLYFEDPTTPITQIGIVQTGFDLCEVGAKLVNPHATEEDLVVLLKGGVLKFAVPFLKERYDPPWEREHCILISDLKDRQDCDVLYLPPMYLVKLPRT